MRYSEPVVGRPCVLVYDSETVPARSLADDVSKPSLSTPENASAENVTQQLRNLIRELGNQIGNLIVAG